jgi:hypothetical protein
MTRGLDCVFVESRETGQTAGYLPLEIFVLKTGDNSDGQETSEAFPDGIRQANPEAAGLE